MDETRAPGCCDVCGGTGLVGLAAVETGGRCWDCYGTGHVHNAGEPCNPSEKE